MPDRSLWPIKVKHNKMSAIKEAFCMPHLSLTFVLWHDTMSPGLSSLSLFPILDKLDSFIQNLGMSQSHYRKIKNGGKDKAADKQQP